MDLPSCHRFRGWDSSPNSMVDFPANLVIDTGGQPGDRAPYGKNTSRITHWPCSIPPINPSWRFPKSWEYPIYHPCDFPIFHWNHPAIGDPPLMEPPQLFWSTEPNRAWFQPHGEGFLGTLGTPADAQKTERLARVTDGTRLRTEKWSNYSFYHWKKIRVGYFNSW